MGQRRSSTYRGGLSVRQLSCGSKAPNLGRYLHTQTNKSTVWKFLSTGRSDNSHRFLEGAGVLYSVTCTADHSGALHYGKVISTGCNYKQEIARIVRARLIHSSKSALMELTWSTDTIVRYKEAHETEAPKAVCECFFGLCGWLIYNALYTKTVSSILFGHYVVPQMSPMIVADTLLISRHPLSWNVIAKAMRTRHRNLLLSNEARALRECERPWLVKHLIETTRWHY